MRRSNFALRLQPSLLEELRKAAQLEGVALNQLINVAVAERVSALRTEEFFRERGRRADRAQTLRILERAGKGNAPVEGDELPPEGSSGGAEEARTKSSEWEEFDEQAAKEAGWRVVACSQARGRAHR